MIQFPHSLAEGIRVVRTAIDADRRSVVVADERIRGEPRALTLWAADMPPTLGDPEPSSIAGWWPPPGGVRVSLFTRPPDHEPDRPRPAFLPDIEESGFHASATTDIALVIRGTIWMELDDGVEVALKAGDTLIQNGTRHRWRNHGNDWPIVAVVIVGAAVPPPEIG